MRGLSKLKRRIEALDSPVFTRHKAYSVAIECINWSIQYIENHDYGIDAETDLRLRTEKLSELNSAKNRIQALKARL